MIGLYNNVTANDANKVTGDLIGAGNKLTVVLNSSLQEVKDTPIAIRTIDSNHKTVGSTTLAFEGSNADKWAFSKDGTDFLGWGAPLTIESEIRNSNQIIYCRTRSLENENAQTDISTQIKVTATIGTIA